MSDMNKNQENQEMNEELVRVNRIVKVTKGGRKFRFSAMMSMGDNNGQVGLGYGKAREVPDAVKKASNAAKKNMISVYLKKNTVPHEVIGRFGSTKVLLKPASPGTGIIAGGIVRSLVAKAGINDLLSKVYGSKNPLNVAKATMDALSRLTNPLDIAKKRGKKISEIFQ
jgi:small subunit ribosomal protein S5